VLRPGHAVVYWEFLDKRAMLSVYVLRRLFLAFLKFLSGICSPPPLLTPNGTGLTMERGPCRPFDAPETYRVRGLWFFVGAALGLGLYAEPIFLNIVRPNIHLDMHLGSIEAIYQGRIPFVEAQTQYGPGNQLLLYWLMRLLDFSYWGAVEAQAIANVTSCRSFRPFDLVLRSRDWGGCDSFARCLCVTIIHCSFPGGDGNEMVWCRRLSAFAR
jgi:hypothetical protein